MGKWSIATSKSLTKKDSILLSLSPHKEEFYSSKSLERRVLFLNTK
jgi:hypothetical protein